MKLTVEKNNLLCKKREKNNLSQGKITAPPSCDAAVFCTQSTAADAAKPPTPRYQMVHPQCKFSPYDNNFPQLQLQLCTELSCVAANSITVVKK